MQRQLTLIDVRRKAMALAQTIITGDKCSPDQVKIVAQLGHGSFGEVYEVGRLTSALVMDRI